MNVLVYDVCCSQQWHGVCTSVRLPVLRVKLTGKAAASLADSSLCKQAKEQWGAHTVKTSHAKGTSTDALKCACRC